MGDFYAAAHQGGNAALALAEVQRDWLVALREGKGEAFNKAKEALHGLGWAAPNDHGVAVAAWLAGPFILSAQGKP